MKNTLFIIIGIILLSCETKEYTPKSDSLRDSKLFFTWKNINVNESDSSFFTFTSEGYLGSTSWINNQQIDGFSNLDGLWYNTSQIDTNGINAFFEASIYDHWTSKRWEHTTYYKIKDDTLYLGSKENNLNDIYIKNSYQLIFEGKIYSGIDSTTQE